MSANRHVHGHVDRCMDRQVHRHKDRCVHRGKTRHVVGHVPAGGQYGVAGFRSLRTLHCCVPHQALAATICHYAARKRAHPNTHTYVQTRIIAPMRAHACLAAPTCSRCSSCNRLLRWLLASTSSPVNRHVSNHVNRLLCHVHTRAYALA